MNKILHFLWLLLAFLFVCKVGYISKSIDGLAREVKRLSYAVGNARVFDMEEVERAAWQKKSDARKEELKRCVMYQFVGESKEDFLRRTQNCPSK